MSTPSEHTCPTCGSAGLRVVEDVSDEVTVYGCETCDATWAVRRDHGPSP